MFYKENYSTSLSKWDVTKNINFINGAKVQTATSCKFVLKILNTWETEANYFVLFQYAKITYNLPVKQFKIILNDNWLSN